MWIGWTCFTAKQGVNEMTALRLLKPFECPKNNLQIFLINSKKKKTIFKCNVRRFLLSVSSSGWIVFFLLLYFYFGDRIEDTPKQQRKSDATQFSFKHFINFENWDHQNHKFKRAKFLLNIFSGRDICSHRNRPAETMYNLYTFSLALAERRKHFRLH